MLVDLVELNIQGKRRPKEEWRHAEPVRVELSVLKYFSWHGQEVAPVFATVRPLVGSPLAIHELHKARLLHASKRSLVLYGDQRIQGATHEQFWWCRLVLDAHANNTRRG